MAARAQRWVYRWSADQKQVEQLNQTTGSRTIKRYNDHGDIISSVLELAVVPRKTVDEFHYTYDSKNNWVSVEQISRIYTGDKLKRTSRTQRTRKLTYY